MSIPYYGDFAEDDTVNIPFNTFSSDDPSASVTITDLVDADIKVHKDAHVDQIVTDGATVVINFDGITGNHMINIDTSVDAAYATGSEYAVRIEGTTVDGATINAWVGAFSIERAGGVLARLETLITTVGALGVGLTAITDNTDEIGAAGVGLAEAGGDGDHLTAINLPNQTMDITGSLSGTVGTVNALAANVITATSINADAITEAKIADNAIAGEHLNATACTKIIDDFETQSQADPTGFHVNVLEVGGTAQTANDNGADINDILTDTETTLDAVVDSILALLDDARGEPGDLAPPVNPDMATKVDYLYKFLRNKIETTATKIHVYDDAGTNKDHTSTISDDSTTFTRGEFAAGDA